MQCAACNKESNNRRVCPYCFTPYPSDAPVSRASSATPRMTASFAGQATVGGARRAAPSAGTGIGGFIRRQSPIVRWSGLGIIVVGLVWYVTGRPDTRLTAPPGEVPANIITAAMSREEALALIKQTRETALVEENSGEVFVSYQASTFPTQTEGQLALAQQFARADELVEGRKRRMTFYNPAGRIFARADGVLGVSLIP